MPAKRLGFGPPTAVGMLILAAAVGGTGQFTLRKNSEQQIGLASTPSATGAITGIAIDGKREQPIPGAVVLLRGSKVAVEGGARQMTDARGRFVLRHLLPGSYRLSASAVGYFGGTYGHDGFDEESIHLAEGEWVRDAQIVLWPPASVGGTIIDEAGEPVTGAYVRALRLVSVAGYPQVAAGPATRSDDRGEYSLANLAGGRYVVVVPSGQAADAEGVGANAYFAPSPARFGRASIYPLRFYPSARTLADAWPIAIDFGDDVHGVDVQLEPLPAFNVSGVVDGPREAMESVTLRLTQSGNEGLVGTESATANVTSDGRFVFRGVPGGTYILEGAPAFSAYEFLPPMGSAAPGERPRLPQLAGFAPSSLVGVMSEPGCDTYFSTARPAGARPYWTRAAIDVVDRDVDNLVVSMIPARTLSGRVEGDSLEGSWQGATVVRAEPRRGTVSYGMPQAIIPRGVTGGSFTLEGLMDGQYWLTATVVGPRPTVVKTIQWNGQDFADRPFDAEGYDIAGVVVTLTTNVARVVGSVRERDDLTPVTNATVAYFPVEPELWQGFGLRPRRMGSVSTDDKGGYAASPLPAGEYCFIATAVSPDESWQTLAWFQAASPLATRVAVGWGETKTLDLSLQRVVMR